MSVIKRRVVGWFEQNVHSRYWRRRCCGTQRPGVCAQTKTLTNRRERREAAREIASQLDEEDQ